MNTVNMVFTPPIPDAVIYITASGPVRKKHLHVYFNSILMKLLDCIAELISIIAVLTICSSYIRAHVIYK